MSKHKPYSVRHASASAKWKMGTSLDTLLKRVGWRTPQAFTQHYHKQMSSSDTTDPAMQWFFFSHNTAEPLSKTTTDKHFRQWRQQQVDLATLQRDQWAFILQSAEQMILGQPTPSTAARQPHITVHRSLPVMFNIGVQTKFEPRTAMQASQTEADRDTPGNSPAGSPDPNNDVTFDYSKRGSPASPVIKVVKTESLVKQQTLLLIPPLMTTPTLNMKMICVPVMTIMLNRNKIRTHSTHRLPNRHEFQNCKNRSQVFRDNWKHKHWQTNRLDHQPKGSFTPHSRCACGTFKTTRTDLHIPLNKSRLWNMTGTYFTRKEIYYNNRLTKTNKLSD